MPFRFCLGRRNVLPIIPQRPPAPVFCPFRPPGVAYHVYFNNPCNNPGLYPQPAPPQVAPPQQVEQQLPKPDLNVILTVVSVNLNIPANTKAHHTSDYDICKSPTAPKLVVRRGQPFTIEVVFSKEYNETTDDLRIVFEAGDEPLVSKGTSVEFILSEEDNPLEWGAKIDSKRGNTVTITVFTPPTCFVGKWNLKLDVVKKVDTKVNIYRYQHKDPIYILFNPWCKDDTVYLADSNLLKEYVLNEKGRIYKGSRNNISVQPWNFGQFESCILDIALYLLEAGRLNWAVRGNPIFVVRKITAMINANDEGGVLVGEWSGNYKGGRAPQSWTGSPVILQEYWRTKQPVKFGQCWVFSGLTTTICRTLGIPTRSVTNFDSAHDTDGSITFDVYFNSKGKCDTLLSHDRLWNYHVWNEAWMARPDLPSGYGGWQAIDATPQEVSDGVCCCGPVSVAAIKQGEVNLPYDGPFVFAEVNADCMHWAPNSEGKLTCIHCEPNAVGHNISTKAPNSDGREDITSNYKPQEGSSDERAAVLRANQVGTNRRDLYKHNFEDVDFKVDQDENSTFVGGDFVLSLVMKNKGTEHREVSGRIEVKTMFYTGVVADPVKSEKFCGIVIKPGEEISQKIVATQENYVDKLKDGCMLDVTIWAVVKETNQHYTKKDNFRLRKPHLTVKAPSDAVVGQEIQVEVSFTNPINRDLTNGFLAVDGAVPSTNFPQGKVASNGLFIATLHLTPYKAGDQVIIFSFNSNQLEDINATHDINLKSA